MNLSRVYPRVCGGAKVLESPHASPRGLSPRVRGSLMPGSPRHGLAWSIPACAGEPLSDMYTADVLSVYPRVCGGAGPLCLRTLS